MRKTDDNVILKLLNEDMTQKEIAAVFGVSPAAICKRVKKISATKPETFESLTKKEQQFALAIAEGKSQTQAASESHDCSSRDSAKSMGYQLAHKNDIQTAVGELMQRSGLTRTYRVQKLKTHVDHADPNVSLKALDQSWKLDGAYTETPDGDPFSALAGYFHLIESALKNQIDEIKVNQDNSEIIEGDYEEKAADD